MKNLIIIGAGGFVSISATLKSWMWEDFENRHQTGKEGL